MAIALLFCGSVSAFSVVRRPKLPNGQSVCHSPLRDQRPTVRPGAAPHMSPDDGDSSSLIIGTDHLEGRKIKVAKSGDPKSGLHKSEVKRKKEEEEEEKKRILAGRFEPKGSTANMKIALGVCTAIGLVIFGVAR